MGPHCTVRPERLQVAIGVTLTLEPIKSLCTISTVRLVFLAWWSRSVTFRGCALPFRGCAIQSSGVITTYVWLRTSASGRSTRLARLKVTFKSAASKSTPLEAAPHSSLFQNFAANTQESTVLQINPTTVPVHMYNPSVTTSRLPNRLSPICHIFQWV